MSANQNSSKKSTPTNPPSDRLQVLATAFLDMLRDEQLGLEKFEQLERKLLDTAKGTPEWKVLRKQRTESIHQVRNARKAQAAIKTQMLQL